MKEFSTGNWQLLKFVDRELSTIDVFVVFNYIEKVPWHGVLKLEISLLDQDILGQTH